MNNTEEQEFPEYFQIIARDGLELHGIQWNIAEPKAVLCIVHGLGEHSGRYHHVAAFFNERGFDVYAFDLRGHGLSKGKRGHTPSHELLLDDVEDLLKHAREEHNDLPMVLFGHSFGGHIVSNYLLKRNVGELAAGVLSSPWLRLAEEPAKWQVSMAKFMVKLLPSFSQSNGLSTADLSKDTAAVKAYEDDTLVHNKISVRLFLETYNASAWAIDNADMLKKETLAYHGAADKIISPEGTKSFHANSKEFCTLKIWDNVRHEPHNDVESKEVLGYVYDWVKKHI